MLPPLITTFTTIDIVKFKIKIKKTSHYTWYKTTLNPHLSPSSLSLITLTKPHLSLSDLIFLSQPLDRFRSRSNTAMVKNKLIRCVIVITFSLLVIMSGACSARPLTTSPVPTPSTGYKTTKNTFRPTRMVAPLGPNLFLNMLPKGTIPPSGPSTGTNRVND